MPRIRFAYSNRVTAATLTASSAQSALPVNAIKNSDRSYIWRSLTQTGTQTIDIDLGSVLAVDTVFVANVKLVGAGVLELWHRGDGGSPGSATQVATLPTQDRDRRVAFAFPASSSHRHWQLKWTNPGAANDYAELGHCFLGTYFEPATNVAVPMPFARPDPSIAGMSIDGQKTYATRTKYAVGEWRWTSITESVLDNLRTMFDAVGIHTPHYVVLDTALSWTAAFARFVGQLEHDITESVSSPYNASLAWEEVR